MSKENLFLMGQKALPLMGQMTSSQGKGSPSTKASLDKDEKEIVKAGMIFQAEAKEKEKQILGKGSLKKICPCKRENK